ncbi:MAG TPA: sigma-70 family RNA polymerase sigma factor [Tepidisphaeraceae bacterium]|nr:sigma-70 family RNA polymerase sigma factor [Tepidisphaeraceae bacterium]
MNESDEALVQKSQRKDRAAFEELVRRTARLVYSRIYLDIPDPHRAEDLVQETFLIAWRSIEQVSYGTGFRPWLLSIARTATLDALRRDSRKKRTAPGKSSADTLTLAIDPQPGPLQSAEKQEQRQRVLEVLRLLPEEYRQPLMLRYFTGADYDTIGKQLGLTNGSLRGLLNRGMARLKEALDRPS